MTTGDIVRRNADPHRVGVVVRVGKNYVTVKTKEVGVVREFKKLWDVVLDYGSRESGD